MSRNCNPVVLRHGSRRYPPACRPDRMIVARDELPPRRGAHVNRRLRWLLEGHLRGGYAERSVSGERGDEWCMMRFTQLAQRIEAPVAVIEDSRAAREALALDHAVMQRPASLHPPA